MYISQVSWNSGEVKVSVSPFGPFNINARASSVTTNCSGNLHPKSFQLRTILYSLLLFFVFYFIIFLKDLLPFLQCKVEIGVVLLYVQLNRGKETFPLYEKKLWPLHAIVLMRIVLQFNGSFMNIQISANERNCESFEE